MYKFEFGDEKDRSPSFFVSTEKAMKRQKERIERLERILETYEHLALDPLPIPSEYEQEQEDLQTTLTEKRIKLAKKISKNNAQLSATELNQASIYLGWPIIAGPLLDIGKPADLWEPIADKFGALDYKNNFTWDGIGFDPNKYENDVEYRDWYDSEYPTTIEKRDLFVVKENDRRPSAYDTVSEIRNKIKNFVMNEDNRVMLSLLPDLDIDRWPDQRIKICWFHNKEQIEYMEV